MFMFSRKQAEMPAPHQVLPGRPQPIRTASHHFVNQRPLQGPYPEGLETAMFGLGCFWGAERKFWELGDGVYVDGRRLCRRLHAQSRPTRRCAAGRTGHNEVVLVVFDPKQICYERLLKLFWESHDPTQGMRQGNDVGTQYRSGIYVYSPAQRQAAEASRADVSRRRCTAKGYGAITTEIRDAPAVLLRRGLSPAISGEKPDGLLRARRHRRELPGRDRLARVLASAGSEHGRQGEGAVLIAVSPPRPGQTTRCDG